MSLLTQGPPLSSGLMRHCWDSHAPAPCSRRGPADCRPVTLTHSYYSVNGWRLSVDSNIYGRTSKSRGHQNCAGIWGHNFQ